MKEIIKMGLPSVEITTQLVDDKVRLKGISNTNADKPVIFDYTPPLGSGDGYAGIELLTMSFSGCVSTAILALLKHRGKTIRTYRMDIRGIKREQPLSLEALEFTAYVGAEGISREELDEILVTAEKISPVWIALRDSVKVTGELRIEP